MKAIVKVRRAPGREGTELQDIPCPRPEPNEVVLKVMAAGLCGSDRHIYNGTGGMQDHMPVPMPYGHEFCGEVAEIGSAVTKDALRVGDYVSAEMHVTCNVCYQCRTGQAHICEKTKILGVDGPGCFAEFVKVPARNVVKLDKKIVPPRIGAFLDALGNAVHTAFEFPFTGKSVAITGYGPIGAMAAAIAQRGGAGSIHITDVNAYSLEQARMWATRGGFDNVHIHDTSKGGAEAVAAVRDHTHGGAHLLWEMSGHPAAINDGFEMLKNGGAAVLLGIPKEKSITFEKYTKSFIYKGITVKGIIGRRMFDTWYRMLALLEAGLSVGHIVTGEFHGLDRFFDAMETFNVGRSLKVVVYPNRRP